jgi:lysozyme
MTPLDYLWPLLKAHEGFRSAPYRDVTGRWTIGYGSTYGLDGLVVDGSHPTVNEDEAEALALRLIDKNIMPVLRCVPLFRTLQAPCIAALIDFCYNLGTPAFIRSTLRKLLVAGDMVGASNEFPKWNEAGGRVLPELVRRRAAERELFLSGVPVAPFQYPPAGVA